MISKTETANALDGSKFEPEVRPKLRPEVGVKRTGNRTTDPNIAVPNSTSECRSILQHWLHFSPFFFEGSNTNDWIWNLLTRTLFNMICRPSNNSAHHIYCPWQCYSTMMVSFWSLFLAPRIPGRIIRILRPSATALQNFHSQLVLDFVPMLTLCSVFSNAPGAFVLWCNGSIIKFNSMIQLFKAKNIYGPGRIKMW